MAVMVEDSPSGIAVDEDLIEEFLLDANSKARDGILLTTGLRENS